MVLMFINFRYKLLMSELINSKVDHRIYIIPKITLVKFINANMNCDECHGPISLW
jgi:hypothetical protein